MASNGLQQDILPCFASGAGIICAGLPRSGTASLANALEILGFGPVHHGLKVLSTREAYAWGQAARSHFSYLPTTFMGDPAGRPPFYVNRADPLLPWRRADWDRVIGHQRVITDLGSLFAEQLITAYPEARVILVERPVDKWITSFTRALVDGVYFGVNGFFLCTLGQYLNLKVIVIGRDMLMGRLKASTRGDVIEKLPTVHKEHHAMVRSRVPPAQLLDLKLQDGWEPLCQFLDVPVPDVPFPHVNDTKQILSMANGMIVKMLTDTGLALGYWVLLATGAGLMLREKSRHHIFELVGGFFRQ